MKEKIGTQIEEQIRGINETMKVLEKIIVVI